MKKQGMCFLGTGKKSPLVAGQDANPEMRTSAFKLVLSGFVPIKLISLKRKEHLIDNVLWGTSIAASLMALVNSLQGKERAGGSCLQGAQWVSL